jgi:hypothetical protein
MAFGKVIASTEGGNSVKRFIGVASFKVAGVNPTKEELSAFYGRTIDKDQVYVTDKTDNDGNPYKQTRVTFLLEATKLSENGNEYETNVGLEDTLKTTVSFFITNTYEYNRDKTKVKVIDVYGRTAWVTIEQAKNHQIPVYSNGPAKLDKDYRPCYRGEEDLTKFIKVYLNIQPLEVYNSNTSSWMPNPKIAGHPEDAMSRLDNILDYVKGDFSELKEIVKLGVIGGVANRFKALVGVRTNNEGNEFQTVYTTVFLKESSSNYNMFKKELENDKNNGRNSDTVYVDSTDGEITNIHEYKGAPKIQETNLNNDPFANSSDMPFSEGNNDPFATI